MILFSSDVYSGISSCILLFLSTLSQYIGFEWNILSTTVLASSLYCDFVSESLLSSESDECDILSIWTGEWLLIIDFLSSLAVDLLKPANCISSNNSLSFFFLLSNPPSNLISALICASSILTFVISRFKSFSWTW